MAAHDPITLEVIKNALDSIADQIALVLMRSAYSPVVRDSLDYSTAVCDRDGRFVAQGLTTALHLGSFPGAMRSAIAQAGGHMRPGDIYVFNDPYKSGGMHVPDIYLIKPVFFKGSVEGYATALVHHADLGGIAPGSMAVYATEIFQEGIVIPFLKLYDEGKPNQTLLDMIASNVRIPRQVLGDLRAQVAGVSRGEQGLSELLARYGADEFHNHCLALHQNAEVAMRRVIASIPNGRYEHEDYIDGLGEEPQPIRFRVAIRVEDDSVSLDWTGTSPQVKAAINAPGPFLASASYLAFRCLAGHEIPNAEGYMTPISVSAPKGTIVNPNPPAAANARGIIGFRVFDTVLGALRKGVPDRIPAGNEGGAINFSVGGQWKERLYVFNETTMGAWGGRPSLDGIDGAANLAANQSNQPIELIEAENPLVIERYSFVPDSGGAGQFRGGLGIIRQYRFLAPDSLLTYRSDRRAQLPPSGPDGCLGSPNLNVLRKKGTRLRLLPVLPMEGYPVEAEDVFYQVLPGGGGYGHPFDRPAGSVVDDVIDRKITRDYAEAMYGVVVRDNGSLDIEATANIRNKRSPADAKRHLPFFFRAIASYVPGFTFREELNAAGKNRERAATGVDRN
jgi:N-methylhydantoinase B